MKGDDCSVGAIKALIYEQGDSFRTSIHFSFKQKSQGY